MRVVHVLALTSIFILSTALLAQNVVPGEEATGMRIAHTLHEMYDAEKNKDLKSVLSNLALDFTEIAGDGGVYHRADVEASWPDILLKDYKLSDCVFRLMTRDSAYLSCILEIDATYKGQPLPKRFRLTTVWSRIKDKWLIRLEQGTVLPPVTKPAE